MSSKNQSSSKPHGTNCVKPFDAKAPPKKGQKKHVFIPKINLAKNGWTQIPFDIAKKSKEEILVSFEKISESYLGIQGMVTPVVKNLVEDTNLIVQWPKIKLMEIITVFPRTVSEETILF